MSKKLALMLGASNHAKTEREQNDFYATEPRAVEKLLSALREDNINLAEKLWEPACGEGHISEVLLAAGYSVRSSDLIDRGYGEAFDFLEQTEDWTGDIITNPPFKLSLPFIQKSLELIPDGNKVLIFQRLNFLESGKRYRFFKDNPFKYIYVHASRVGTAMNADFERFHAKSMAYAWYIWEKGYQGESMMRWIP